MISVNLIAIRCLIKFSRRFKGEELAKFASKFETILDPLLGLLNSVSLECMSLPIEAFAQFSKTNEQTVAHLTPKVTPQLLLLFKNHHHEGALGTELISLFKLWCNYEQCRAILIVAFLPQALQMVGSYYNFTPNVDNKAATMTEKLASLALSDQYSLDKSKTEEEYR